MKGKRDGENARRRGGAWEQNGGWWLLKTEGKNKVRERLILGAHRCHGCLRCSFWLERERGSEDVQGWGIEI